MILLEDELNVGWRAQIIDALGWSKDFSVMEVLNKAVADTDPAVRSAALSAFAGLGHPAAAPWVLASLRDPDMSVRLQGISTTTQLGLRSALPQLFQLLEDEELWVRLRAEQAIEELSPANNRVDVTEAVK